MSKAIYSLVSDNEINVKQGIEFNKWAFSHNKNRNIKIGDLFILYYKKKIYGAGVIISEPQTGQTINLWGNGTKTYYDPIKLNFIKSNNNGIDITSLNLPSIKQAQKDCNGKWQCALAVNLDGAGVTKLKYNEFKDILNKL